MAEFDFSWDDLAQLTRCWNPVTALLLHAWAVHIRHYQVCACLFQGVMRGAIPWKTLETQFFENSIYQEEISKLIVSPEDVSLI